MLDRDLPIGSWTVPTDVELDAAGEHLVWRSLPSRSVAPAPGVMHEFVLLAGASAEAILAFARRWGVLGICEHGLPARHNAPMWMAGQTYEHGCKPVAVGEVNPIGREGTFVEPIDAWRRLAHRVRAVVTLATRLHDGEPGSAEDWSAALAMDDSHFKVTLLPRPDGGPENVLINPPSPWTLIMAAQEIINLGGVRPQLRWAGDAGYTITIGAGDSEGNQPALFAAVAAQLAFALARSDDLAICSGCGEPYSLDADGRPRRGLRRFCRRCREAGVPDRLKQRDARARRKEQRPAAGA
jgi:hypothetical protein